MATVVPLLIGLAFGSALLTVAVLIARHPRSVTEGILDTFLGSGAGGFISGQLSSEEVLGRRSKAGVNSVAYAFAAFAAALSLVFFAIAVVSVARL